MIRFAHPEYFMYLFGLLPLAGFFWFVWYRKRALLRTFGEQRTVLRLVAGRSRVKHWLRASLLLAAAASIVTGLANPRIGTKYEEVKRSGIDLIVALDVSASMLAKDITPNRLTAAKRELEQVIENLHGDRIGLIVFAGDAYTQLPLTSDYSAASMLTDIVDVGSAPTPGTAIGSAIDLARKSFKKDEGKYKAMIIITDGENHEDDPVAAAKEAAAAGIVIHTVGMGSAQGAPIPLGEGTGGEGFKRDNEGNMILSKLDENTLREIASVTGGTYTRASNSRNDLATVFREINRMEKKEFGTKQFTSYEDRFQWLIAVAVLLLVVEAMMSETRNRFLARFAVFAPKDSGEIS